MQTSNKTQPISDHCIEGQESASTLRIPKSAARLTRRFMGLKDGQYFFTITVEQGRIDKWQELVLGKIEK